MEIERMHLRARLLWLSFLLLSMAPIVCEAQPNGSFTLKQALSAPFNSDLVAAPTGGRFAWVANAEGRRNVWVAEPGGSGYTSRQVTNYPADDGQDIGEVRWSQDGESLAYTRGGDLEFTEKPEPNPALLPAGIEQDVYLLSLKGGEPRKIGAGREPAFSPKGDTLAYVVKGQIWTVSLADPNAKPEQVLHTRGHSGSLRWSPDGSALAFVSGRSDHGFVGVYSIAE
jgi:Tol biopolymer transport system component